MLTLTLMREKSKHFFSNLQISCFKWSLFIWINCVAFARHQTPQKPHLPFEHFTLVWNECHLVFLIPLEHKSQVEDMGLEVWTVDQVIIQVPLTNYISQAN